MLQGVIFTAHVAENHGLNGQECPNRSMRRKDNEVTNIHEIEEILKACKTCYLAMAEGSIPYVVPLSYGYAFTAEGALELYFHSAHEGRKLELLKQNSKVCFCIANEGEPAAADTPCNAGYYYASVIGSGEVVFLHDSADKCAALSALVKQQRGKEAVFLADQAETVCVFKLVSTEFTGKRKSKP